MASIQYFDYPFDLPESVYAEDYVIATYIAHGLSWGNALSKTGGFAAGQSIGTWLPLPGVTRPMVENYQARVVGCYPVAKGEETSFILRLAFPMCNFGGSLAILLTALVGNDVSTAIRVKLIDLEFTGKSLKGFHGPSQGVDGLRKITGVYDRPLVLNMIKPCLGFSPEDGAALFYESGKGGVDLIKDDELHGTTDISNVADRVRAYNQAADRIFDEHGRKPVYIVNVSDRPSRMVENIKAAMDEGAQAVMVNYVTTGLDSLVELTEQFGKQVAFLAHYAGVGVFDHENQGIASPVILGKLARLGGADSVMVMYPGDKLGPGYFEYLRTIQAHRFEFGGFKPVMSSIGGGVTPLSVGSIYEDMGKDVIMGVGGAIQGHPLGPEAGARAVMHALKAAVAGQSLDEAAASCPELQKAVDVWG